MADLEKIRYFSKWKIKVLDDDDLSAKMKMAMIAYLNFIFIFTENKNLKDGLGIISSIMICYDENPVTFTKNTHDKAIGFINEITPLSIYSYFAGRAHQLPVIGEIEFTNVMERYNQIVEKYGGDIPF